MRTKAGIKAGSLMVVALPLFMAVGCAGNKPNMLQDDALQTDTVRIDAAQVDVTQSDAAQSDTPQSDLMQQDSTVHTAIATMDGYVAQLETSPTPEQKQETQSIELEGGSAVNDESTTDPGNEASQAAADSDVSPAETEVADVAATSNETDAAPADDVIAVSVNDDDATASRRDEGVLSIPPQLVFYFGTNSDTPSATDTDMLIQHAEYLQRHPNMVLMIRGHADSRGAKAYNQRLSEKRAINVATILLAAGVSGEQLRIDGMGADVPMADMEHWKQNRRVEFTYMDSMVAQKN